MQINERNTVILPSSLQLKAKLSHTSQFLGNKMFVTLMVVDLESLSTCLLKVLIHEWAKHFLNQTKLLIHWFLIVCSLGRAHRNDHNPKIQFITLCDYHFSIWLLHFTSFRCTHWVSFTWFVPQSVFVHASTSQWVWILRILISVLSTWSIRCRNILK